MSSFTVAIKFRIVFTLIIAFQAILIAYAPIYFSSIGYSPFEVSLISGMENVMAIFGPMFLVSRRYPAGLGITTLSAISALFTVCISPHYGAFILVLLWSISLFFNRGVFVLINEEAQARDRQGLLKYSESRSWGSASFLMAMYGLGLLAERKGIASIIEVGAILLALLALVGLGIRDIRTEVKHQVVSDFIKSSFNLWHLYFYVALTLVWASHGPAYTYLSLHLLNLGWSPSEIAISWNIAVITEIVAFLLFYRIERLISLDKLLTISLLVSVLRWLMLSQTSNSVIITLSQCLHGITFGLCFLTSQKLLRQSVTEEYSKAAFAIYFALSTGFGSLLGKLMAGGVTASRSFDGDFHQVFSLGTYSALVSLIIWCARSTNPTSSSKVLVTDLK